MSENKRHTKEENMDIIMNTTLRLINEKGYNNISTNEIAKEAYINISLLYRYFEGKPGIMKEITKQRYAEFLEEQQLNKITREKLPIELKRILKIYIKQHKNNVSLVKAMEMAFLENPSIFKDLDYVRTELKLVPLISDILIRAGYPEKEKVKELAALFLYSIDAIVHHHVIYGDIVDDDDKLVEFLSEIILKYVGIKE